ncbi:hypothetical protein [Ottowia sp.]|uniref:hypothetical protein n=1 Tax=Ottowia sp. TaxID=1898956 RepID=UPI0025E4349D|nr:hypothetical protein [Ottowia sp.]MBK6613699.1 hypothetical protein [Ottowia sp.]
MTRLLLQGRGIQPLHNLPAVGEHMSSDHLRSALHLSQQRAAETINDLMRGWMFKMRAIAVHLHPTRTAGKYLIDRACDHAQPPGAAAAGRDGRIQSI